MADSNGVSPGTPSWVDLGSPDVDASVKFYGDLFGWTADEGSPESVVDEIIGVLRKS